MKIVSGWQPDDCQDPQHQKMQVEHDSEIWELHETMRGYGFTARPLPYNRDNAGRLVHAYSLEDLEARLAG